MPPPTKTGPLTREELLEVWRGATDRSYNRPLLEVGEGRGLEVVTQTMEQLARASRGIDLTTQALYIRPSSAETGPPAGGANNAQVVLTFRRSKLLERPMLLAAGQTFYEEETTDWGDSGGVEVRTGRLYTLTENLVFHPGEMGPFDVIAIAERPGYGFNNPLPGTIRHPVQPGANFFHERATVVWAPQPTPEGTPAARLDITAVNEADMFVPEHVGQYVIFTAGANVGNTGRVVSFVAPNASINIGSGVQLAVEHSFEAFTWAGTVDPGEGIHFFNVGPILVGTGRVLGSRVDGTHLRVTYILLTGTEGSTATGDMGGATFNVDIVLHSTTFASEEPISGSGASWRVLGWESDWGLEITNVLSPQGGRMALLDAIGAERNIQRAPYEDDETYRSRIAEISDVVAPNAIRRMLNRVLAPLPWCFREVGSSALPGFFYDGDNSPAGELSNTNIDVANKLDAYDTDVVVMTGFFPGGPPFEFQEPVQLEDTSNNMKVAGYFGRLGLGTFTLIRKVNQPPASLVGLRVRGLRSGAIFNPFAYVLTPTVDERRFRYYLDYVQFRAFFLVGVPALSEGEFGFAYDAGPFGAYDTSPYLSFYDGFAAEAAALYRNVWQAIEAIRAGGVSWELQIERIGCP